MAIRKVSTRIKFGEDDEPLIKTPKEHRKLRIIVWILIIIALMTFYFTVVGEFVDRRACLKVIRDYGVKIPYPDSMTSNKQYFDKKNVDDIAEKGEGFPDNDAILVRRNHANTRDEAPNSEYPFGIMDPKDQGWSNAQGTTDSTREDYKPTFGTMDSASEDSKSVFGIRDSVSEDVKAVFEITDTENEDEKTNFGTMDSSSEDEEPEFGTMDSSSEDVKAIFETVITKSEEEKPEFGTTDSSSKDDKPEFDTMDTIEKKEYLPYRVMDYEDERGSIWRHRYSSRYEKVSYENRTKASTSYKWRLPKEVVPQHYNLEIKPHLEGNFSFEGQVEILLKVKKEVSVIILHASAKFGLHVHNDTIALSPAKSIIFEGVANPTNATRPAETSLDFEKELLILNFKNPLKVGSYNLKMKFHGTLKHSDYGGFYLSQNVDKNNKTEYQAVTQFESVKARTAFPCFDEPAMKATFVVTVVHQKGLKCISNTPLAKSKDSGSGWVADTFEKTVKLPTYLVAFIVSDFGFKGDPKEFAAWSKKDTVDQLDYAVQVGPKLLAHLEQLFLIKLELRKMDVAAIPDFAAGAMENWGLVTFTERALLYDPTDHVYARKLRVVNYMTHEFTHMWFGDLVTPEWWNDLWVKEGFAAYFEVFGMAGALDNFDFGQYFVIQNLQNTFWSDWPSENNKVSLPVLTPDQIGSRYSDMSYSKPSCLIRMMRTVLGDKAFFRGLNKYLTKHSYGNTVQDDVFEAWNSAQKGGDKVNVKKIMDTWTLQPSHPVVMVTRDYKNNTATLSQEFLSKSKKNYTWYIPVSMTDGKNPNMDDVKPKLWLTAKKGIIKNVAEHQYWLLINVQQTGFYRVNYDNKNWQLLYAQLKSDYKKINVLCRSQIIDDTFAFARFGVIPYNLALNVTLYLDNEIQYAPLNSFWLNFIDIDDSLKSKQAFYEKFNAYFNKKMSNALKILGWEDKSEDSLLTKMTRSDLITWLLGHEEKRAIDKARSLFKQYKTNPNSKVLYPDIQLSVFCAEVSEGGNQSYQYVMDNFEKVQKPNQRQRLLASLGCVKDEVLLRQALDMCLTDVRFPDGCRQMFTWATKRFSNQKMMFNYIDAKFDTVAAKFSKRTLRRLIANVANTMSTDSDISQMEEFMTKHKIFFKDYRLTIRYNKTWLKRNFGLVKLWFEAAVQE